MQLVDIARMKATVPFVEDRVAQLEQATKSVSEQLNNGDTTTPPSPQQQQQQNLTRPRATACTLLTHATARALR